MINEFKITHTLNYSYSDNIFLEPHQIRLVPRDDSFCRLRDYQVKVTPTPAGMSEGVSPEGSRMVNIWFDGMARSLSIKVCSTVEMKPSNPFNFLIYPPFAQRLPIVFPPEFRVGLTEYLDLDNVSTEVQEWAEKIAMASGRDTVSFLTRLCQHVQENFEYEKREDGEAYAPAKLLKLKKGSCRDFAVLCQAACRDLGLPARFASGYMLSDNDAEPAELHAWFEVYLPGVGWKGFDPSHGMACCEKHITLATSSDAGQTSPVVGSFRGTAISKIDFSLDVQPTQKPVF